MKKRVALTREPPFNDELRDALSSTVRITEIPLTRTVYCSHTIIVDELASHPRRDTFATLAITSARAAQYLECALAFAADDAVVAVLGRATMNAVLAAGAVSADRVVALAQEENAAALGALIERGPVLALSANNPRPELRTAVLAKGLVFDEVVCYSTQSVELTKSERRGLRRAQVVVIGAPSAWNVARHEVSPHAVVVTWGETTASAVRADHAVVRVAKSSDPANVADAVLAP